MSARDAHAELVQEAERLHRRYLREVIERYSICPWAKAARMEERMRTHVVVERDLQPHALRGIVDAWASDAAADVAFVIVPRFDQGYDAFVAWTAEVGALRDEVFLSAPFHPHPPEPAGTIRFLRQTPHPTAQLVRRERLEEIRAQDPPHYADIFSLDLRELEPGRPMLSVAAAVLAHNDRLVADHTPELRTLLRGQAPPPKND